jgi:hypothetical protein
VARSFVLPPDPGYIKNILSAWRSSPAAPARLSHLARRARTASSRLSLLARRATTAPARLSTWQDARRRRNVRKLDRPDFARDSTAVCRRPPRTLLGTIGWSVVVGGRDEHRGDAERLEGGAGRRGREGAAAAGVWRAPRWDECWTATPPRAPGSCGTGARACAPRRRSAWRRRRVRAGGGGGGRGRRLHAGRAGPAHRGRARA